MNIYLDIYGTLIANASPIADRETLLKYILDSFPGRVYWLTSFSPERVIDVLGREFSELLLGRLETEVNYLSYQHYKSDAINFDEPFFWLDDNQSEADYYALKEHDALSSFIHMNPQDSEMAQKALATIKNSSALNRA
jgi:hypothetical protein